MKNNKPCTVCDKRSKKEPMKAGYKLCQKHYDMMLDGKIKVDKN